MTQPAAVTLAYVHDTENAHSFTDSLVNLLMFDAANHGRIMRGGYSRVRYGTGGIVGARNMAASGFLTRLSEWLFIVDTDMGFEPDTLERLLEVADPVDRPIVGGLCFAQKEIAQDGMGGFRCSPRVTIMDWVTTEKGPQFAGVARYPVNAVVKCGATGSACILIHRSVIEAIDAAAPEGKKGTWYDRIPGTDGSLLGEDVSFCVRAGALGFPVHVHTGVKTTHFKHLWLGEADFWRASVAPPAVEPVAVIVPVMGRPQNAAPFMESLRASTGLATVYAFAADGDDETANAWADAGAHVAQNDLTTFAEKVNFGYARQTDEPWLFLVGDDVRFHPGWLDHAQHAAGDTFDVIGTNDLGNPRVTAGEHATHLLIRRSYIDEHGASWDGPKVVAHEGYRHWYVDDEIVTVAKQRGVWAMALGSVVEHLHPAWGKADTDAVYELGQSHAGQDRKTFEARCRRFR